MTRFGKYVAGLMLGSALMASAASAEPVTLTFQTWVGGDPETAKAWQEIMDLVTEKYPDIVVDMQTAPWTDYWTKLSVQAASDQTTDIVSMQSMRVPNFHQIMDPLDAYVARDNFALDEFVPSIIEGMSHGGHLYGLPVDIGPWLMYYNKDRFDAAGLTHNPAWTTEDFRAAAKALTSDGKYGFGVIPFLFAIWTTANGVSYVAEDGSYQLDSPEVIASVEELAALVTTDKVAPPVGSASAEEVNMGRFDTGEVAMFVDGPWALGGRKVKFQLGLLPMPTGPDGLSIAAGFGLGISAASQHKEEAWKAIQVITGPEALATLAKAGRALPARTAEQKYWYDFIAKDTFGATEAIAYAMEHSRSFPTGNNWNILEGLLNQYLPLAFSGSQSVAETMATIQDLAEQAQ